jgi:proteic killer suppression protein
MTSVWLNFPAYCASGGSGAPLAMPRHALRGCLKKEIPNMMLGKRFRAVVDRCSSRMRVPNVLPSRRAALADGISSGYESLAIRIPVRYALLVIRNFKGKFAEPILQGRVVSKGFPANLAKVARRKLIMVDAAAFLEALNSPPGNRLEALKGDLAGKHLIPVNDQWRVVFRWTDAGPEDVEIIDYH